MQKNTAQATMPIRISALTIRWAPNTTAADVITSDSLPQAKILPLKVIPPIIMDSKIVMLVKVLLSMLYNAAQPTIRLATPPEPLKSATISGMLVISTFCATTAPTMPPIKVAPIIHSQGNMFLLNKVTAIAMNMPNDDRVLPRTAVAGDPSCFRPKMNSAAAATYHRLISSILMPDLLVVQYLSS